MRPERRGAAGILALAACAGVFALGLAGLFRDRLETGDIYPPGSSLRSDPMGARALFEALDRYPGVEASRAYSYGDLRGAGAGDAVFFLGLDAEHPPGGDLLRLDTLARAGSRAVGVFAGKAGDIPDTAGDKPGTVSRAIPGEALPPWGFLIRPRGSQAPRPGLRNCMVPADGGPGCIPLAGGAWFDSLAPEWRVLYRAGGKPVVIERALGAGSVALAADAYFASNEAMREPPPSSPAPLAALLAGRPSRILFDERHLGVRRDDGLVDLLIGQRLHWALPSLLLLLGLFLWQARARPLPVPTDRAEIGAIPDTRTALAALLRRSLGDRAILGNCLRLWGQPGKASADPASDPRIRKILDRPFSGSDPLAAAYGEIQTILNPRKTK